MKITMDWSGRPGENIAKSTRLPKQGEFVAFGPSSCKVTKVERISDRRVRVTLRYSADGPITSFLPGFFVPQPLPQAGQDREVPKDLPPSRRRGIFRRRYR